MLKPFLFFYLVELPRVVRANPRSSPEPRQPCKPAQTRTNNITGPIGYGKICSYRLKKIKIFFAKKNFFKFFIFPSWPGRFFVRFLPNFRVFTKILSDFFIFDWHFGSISLELFVFIRTIFVRKFTKKS